MIPDTRKIDRLLVYQYTFLDDLSFILSPYDYYSDAPKTAVDEFIEGLRQLFLRNGWEGDGEIGLIWLPPFIDCGVEDTWGTYIWHVKQSNNGISFLASEHPLEFRRLKEQNEHLIAEDGRDRIPVNIIQTSVDVFLNQIAEQKKNLQDMLTHLQKAIVERVVDNIIHSVTSHSQGILVRCLHEFLDECYLQFLIEAIDSGNPSNIKIRKSQVHLAPSQYIPEDSLDEENAIEGGKWFTLKGIVSDMWRAYKFEPFKNKIEMLFKSIDFNWDPAKLSEISKHVILRNCMQHHEGVLDKDSLKQLGLAKVTLLGKDSPYDILPWEPIWFSDVELNTLSDLLVDFAKDFNSYVDKRISTRHYLVAKKNVE